MPKGLLEILGTIDLPVLACRRVRWRHNQTAVVRSISIHAAFHLRPSKSVETVRTVTDVVTK
jgi:hypothetical protein